MDTSEPPALGEHVRDVDVGPGETLNQPSQNKQRLALKLRNWEETSGLG